MSHNTALVGMIPELTHVFTRFPHQNGLRFWSQSRVSYSISQWWMHPVIQTSAHDTPTEQLAGSVERVTFHSEETGFCVLRVKVRGRWDLETVVGTAPSITP